MDEQQTIRKIFGEELKWKGKSQSYDLDWCELCDCATITSPCGCHGSSCNCGGCEKCIEDHKNFSKSKIHVSDYLTEEEFLVYKKGLKLRKLIVDSLKENEKKINWKKLRKEKKHSMDDLVTFKNFFNLE